MNNDSEKNKTSTEPRNPEVILDRDPGIDFAAGEISSINNNEDKGGDPLGKEHKAKAFDDFNEYQKSKSGLITAEKKNPWQPVKDIFENDFINKTFTSFHARIEEGWIEVEVFMLTLPKSRYMDSNGREQYNRIIYPVGKVVKNSGMTSKYQNEEIVKLPNNISEYGPNPEWTAWAQSRNSSDVMAAAEAGNVAAALGYEPPKYWGEAIMGWILDYGVNVSPFDAYSNFTTRFLIPENFIHATLNAEQLVDHLQQIINETNEDQV